MASHAAHHSTGWAAGVLAAALVSQAGGAGHYQQWAILTACAAAAGGTAPDWLEQAWWSRGRARWITHRTWTHWGLAWLAALVLAWINLRAHPAASLGVGFAAGGLMHLLADWPNPLGVPWLFRHRYSLRWWNSGRCDWLIIVSVWCAALWVGDRAWWHGHITAAAVALLRRAG